MPHTIPFKNLHSNSISIPCTTKSTFQASFSILPLYYYTLFIILLWVVVALHRHVCLYCSSLHVRLSVGINHCIRCSDVYEPATYQALSEREMAHGPITDVYYPPSVRRGKYSGIPVAILPSCQYMKIITL